MSVLDDENPWNTFLQDYAVNSNCDTKKIDKYIRLKEKLKLIHSIPIRFVSDIDLVVCKKCNIILSRTHALNHIKRHENEKYFNNLPYGCYEEENVAKNKGTKSKCKPSITKEIIKKPRNNSKVVKSKQPKIENQEFVPKSILNSEYPLKLTIQLQPKVNKEVEKSQINKNLFDSLKNSYPSISQPAYSQHEPTVRSLNEFLKQYETKSCNSKLNEADDKFCLKKQDNDMNTIKCQKIVMGQNTNSIKFESPQIMSRNFIPNIHSKSGVFPQTVHTSFHQNQNNHLNNQVFQNFGKNVLRLSGQRKCVRSFRIQHLDDSNNQTNWQTSAVNSIGERAATYSELITSPPDATQQREFQRRLIQNGIISESDVIRCNRVNSSGTVIVSSASSHSNIHSLSSNSGPNINCHSNFGAPPMTSGNSIYGNRCNNVASVDSSSTSSGRTKSFRKSSNTSSTTNRNCRVNYRNVVNISHLKTSKSYGQNVVPPAAKLFLPRNKSMSVQLAYPVIKQTHSQCNLSSTSISSLSNSTAVLANSRFGGSSGSLHQSYQQPSQGETTPELSEDEFLLDNHPINSSPTELLNDASPTTTVSAGSGSFQCSNSGSSISGQLDAVGGGGNGGGCYYNHQSQGGRHINNHHRSGQPNSIMVNSSSGHPNKWEQTMSPAVNSSSTTTTTSKVGYNDCLDSNTVYHHPHSQYQCRNQTYNNSFNSNANSNGNNNNNSSNLTSQFSNCTNTRSSFAPNGNLSNYNGTHVDSEVISFSSQEADSVDSGIHILHSPGKKIIDLPWDLF